MDKKEIEAVINDAAIQFGVKPLEIKSKSRKEELAYCRSLICSILRERGVKVVYIGEIIGFANHTAVIHYSYAHKRNIKESIKYSNAYNYMRKKYITSSIEEQIKHHETQLKKLYKLI
jgi:chromosomal replication initiation ATPase DnaA